MLLLLCKRQNTAEYWLMSSPIINLWGVRFNSVFSVFSVKAGWIAEILYAVLCLCNKRKKAEYEAKWLISVLIIIIEVRACYSFLQC